MALFAISVLSASTPSWSLVGLGDISFDGSLEVSGNAANNEVNFSPANDHRGGTATRTRLGMNAKVTDDVTGRVELTRSPRQYGTGATTVAGEEALWTIQNAYVNIDNLWSHDFRLGRQYVGESNDLVWHIGVKRDDSLTITSIDGISAKCNKSQPKGDFRDKVLVTLFTGKLNEDDGIANTDASDTTGDINLSNIQLDLSIIPNGNLRVGFLRGEDANTSASTDSNKLSIWRVGVNGGIAENMFTYHAEFLKNSGEAGNQGLTGSGGITNLDYKGTALDLGLGFNAPETSIGTFGAWLNIVMASGDDNVTDGTDDSFHDFSALGTNTSGRHYGEIFGKSNTLGSGTPLGQGIDTADATGVAPSGTTQGQGLEIVNIGVNYKPAFAPKSWVRLDFFTFTRAEDTVTVPVGATVNGATVADGSASVGDDFGTEIDLTFGYNHSDNVGIEFGYAMLNSDDALVGVNAATNVAALNDDAVTKLFARTNIKWGGADAE